ncbi:MAG: YgfZ/GcvT domain-containing protein [Roseinatronobacter sp.]
MTRAILRVSGPDAVTFLQGLVTNDVRKLADARILYAALLTPQGKYLADFFLVADGDDILIDLDVSLADDVALRLNRYKLRSQVSIARDELAVSRGTGPAPDGALPDPRNPALGWRLYGAALPDDGTDWTALHVAHAIPQSGAELVPDDSYILEHGFERLHGVDFRKGCYVGQEVTARMHHKTELRKGLTVVGLSGPVPFGTPILAGGKEAGEVLTQSGAQALAYLRFDRATPVMQAGDATVTWSGSA